VNAQSQHALTVLLGAAPAAAQPRDAHGRYAAQPGSVDPHGRGFTPAARVPFDAGARRTPPQRRDPLVAHGQLIVGLVRAKRFGPSGPSVGRPGGFGLE
jgi:hypothetical protein